jgi:hypothetical protein
MEPVLVPRSHEALLLVLLAGVKGLGRAYLGAISERLTPGDDLEANLQPIF